jgi:hypothetical protein
MDSRCADESGSEFPQKETQCHGPARSSGKSSDTTSGTRPVEAVSSVELIVIPSSVELLDSSCFRCCESLSSTSFESNSRLMGIELNA